MTNYVTMRTRIADEMVDEAITTSHINNAIQSAIKYYERTEFYFNQTSGTFNTVSGQEWYGVADFAAIPNFVKIKSLTAVYGGINTPIPAADYQELDEVQTGQIIGFPNAYAYYKQSIRFFPIPNGAFPVTVSYVTRFATLSADSDTNAWMTDAEELIRNAAKLRLAVDVIKDDEDAQRCSARAQDILEVLQAETGRRIKQPVLRPGVPTNRASSNMARGYIRVY